MSVSPKVFDKFYNGDNLRADASLAVSSRVEANVTNIGIKVEPLIVL